MKNGAVVAPFSLAGGSFFAVVGVSGVGLSARYKPAPAFA